MYPVFLFHPSWFRLLLNNLIHLMNFVLVFLNYEIWLIHLYWQGKLHHSLRVCWLCHSTWNREWRWVIVEIKSIKRSSWFLCIGIIRRNTMYSKRQRPVHCARFKISLGIYAGAVHYLETKYCLLHCIL